MHGSKRSCENPSECSIAKIMTQSEKPGLKNNEGQKEEIEINAKNNLHDAKTTTKLKSLVSFITCFKGWIIFLNFQGRFLARRYETKTTTRHSPLQSAMLVIHVLP